MSRRTIRRLLVRAAFVVVLVIILYAGLGGHPVPEAFHEEDKLYHLLGFAALMVCARLAIPRGRWWWHALAVLALGGVIELVQTLQPGRVGSLWDFLFDAIGVGIGCLLLLLPTLRQWAAR